MAGPEARGGGGEGVWEMGAGSGEPQLLEAVALVLQSRVREESRRGMPSVREGLILRVSGCETEPVA